MSVWVFLNLRFLSQRFLHLVPAHASLSCWMDATHVVVAGRKLKAFDAIAANHQRREGIAGRDLATPLISRFTITAM